MLVPPTSQAVQVEKPREVKRSRQCDLPQGAIATRFTSKENEGFVLQMNTCGVANADLCVGVVDLFIGGGPVRDALRLKIKGSAA